MGDDTPQDFQLSEHFGFFELTKTSQTELQDKNRIEGLNFVNYLKALAALLEKVRTGLAQPLNINSGFRCEAVNGGTPGSAKTSQHLMGQACDFTPASYDGSEASFDFLFNAVRDYLKNNGIPFGQLIKEQAERNYGVARWIHLSLGAPYRDPARCGQVMEMKAGPDGAPHYVAIEVIPQPEA